MTRKVTVYGVREYVLISSDKVIPTGEYATANDSTGDDEYITSNKDDACQTCLRMKPDLNGNRAWFVVELEATIGKCK